MPSVAAPTLGSLLNPDAAGLASLDEIVTPG
jgi:hypothetical protein